MDAYTDFATVYELFMEDTPYEEWADRIAALIAKYDGKTKTDNIELESEASLLVDLGCGTGSITRLMSIKGFDCIGIDSSMEMLEIARSHETDSDILYLCQDMRELDLYSTVGCIISVCDCINYLLEEDDILTTFKKVNNYLYPGGLFIFDFNTIHKYRDVIGDTTIAENREEGSFIWENYYDDDSQINEYDLTIYIKNQDGTYNRSEETHVQRGYDSDTILKLVEEAGLEVVCTFDSDTEDEITDETERVLVVAKEKMKEV